LWFGLVSPVVIAIRIAMDPACSITKAEFPAAFIIAVAGAELRAVESGKQSAAAGLAGNRRQRVLRRYRSGGGVL
jgi:ethanolamine utilization protein EutA (predicted chaperonin)